MRAKGSLEPNITKEDSEQFLTLRYTFNTKHQLGAWSWTLLHSGTLAHLQHQLTLLSANEDHFPGQPVARARAADQEPWCDTHVGATCQDLFGILET